MILCLRWPVWFSAWSNISASFSRKLNNFLSYYYVSLYILIASAILKSEEIISISLVAILFQLILWSDLEIDF